MVFNYKALTMALVLGATFCVRADDQGYSEEKYLSIKEVIVREISQDVLGQNIIETIERKALGPRGLPSLEGEVDTIERAGKVIGVVRDLVALGEDVYKLVIKGKPTNTTTYTPISVIPRIDGEAVDIFATENWKIPVKHTYEIIYKNTYGMDVVTFRYSVIFSYGGTYDGRGAYLTAVQIVPESVRTLFGFDFTATMKLGGIINRGTRTNPLAGATLLMEYTVSSLVVAENKVDSFFVSGTGHLKKL